MNQALPQAIGSRIRISTDDPSLRRWVEWRGFVPESGTQQNLIMRRDFHDGTLAYLEPPRPSFR
jgi:hypothetical protein